MAYQEVQQSIHREKEICKFEFHVLMKVFFLLSFLLNLQKWIPIYLSCRTLIHIINTDMSISLFKIGKIAKVTAKNY